MDTHELHADPQARTCRLTALLQPIANRARCEESDGLAAEPGRQDVTAQNGDGEIRSHELPGHSGALTLDVSGGESEDDFVDAETED